MGDIPIGVSACSVDVFANPEIFDLDWYGGAPYSMGVLEKAQRPFRESLALSGPGQMSYELVDRAVTERTLERLEEIADARRMGDFSPFALHVGYMLPHQPYVGDPDLFRYYADKVAPPRLARSDEGNNTYLNCW